MPQHADDEFLPYGEHHVIVPIDSNVLAVYRHKELGALLLEDGKQRLEDCAHPDASQRAYVLPRYIVRPVAAYLQRIGTNGKKRPSAGKQPSKKQQALEAYPVIGPPPLLPPPALPPLPPVDVLSTMSNEVLVQIFSSLDLADWNALSHANKRLRAIAMDPRVFLGVLSRMPIRKVHKRAKAFIRRQSATIAPDSDLLQLMDGFAQRYADVEGARYYLIELCYDAVILHQYAFLGVLLERTPQRRNALVDLRDQRDFDMRRLIANASANDKQAVAATLHALVEWNPMTDVQVSVLIFPQWQFDSSSYSLRSYSWLSPDDIFQLILRHNTIEHWIRTILQQPYPLYTVALRPLLPRLLTALVQKGTNVTSVILRFAMELGATFQWKLDCLRDVSSWRGPGGEYVDLAQCFEAPVKIVHNYLQSYDTAQSFTDRLILFLDWRSPDGARYVNLRDRRVLCPILETIFTLNRSDETLCLAFLAAWRDPAQFKHIPLALFMTCARYQQALHVFPIWFPDESTGPVLEARTDEIVSASDMRAILARIDWFAVTELRVSSLMRHYSVAVGEERVVPAAVWLMVDGGVELYNAVYARMVSLDDVITLTVLAQNDYNALVYCGLMCVSPLIKMITGKHVVELITRFHLSAGDLPEGIAVLARFENYTLTAQQKAALSAALLAKANRLRAAAGLGPNAITEVLDF